MGTAKGISSSTPSVLSQHHPYYLCTIGEGEGCVILTQRWPHETKSLPPQGVGGTCQFLTHQLLEGVCPTGSCQPGHRTRYRTHPAPRSRDSLSPTPTILMVVVVVVGLLSLTQFYFDDIVRPRLSGLLGALQN